MDHRGDSASLHVITSSRKRSHAVVVPTPSMSRPSGTRRQHHRDVTPPRVETPSEEPVQLRPNEFMHLLGLPLDHWHVGKSFVKITPNTSLYLHIPFESDSTPSIPGVALTMGCIGQGIKDAYESSLSYVPEQYIPPDGCVNFDINWPGYQHLCWSTTLCLFDIYDQPLSNRDLVKSICEIYRRFIRDRGVKEFKEPGLLIGVEGGVKLYDLRLHQIYTTDHGDTWQAEVSCIMH